MGCSTWYFANLSVLIHFIFAFTSLLLAAPTTSIQLTNSMQQFGGKMLAWSLNPAIHTASVDLLKVLKFMRKVSDAQVQVTKWAGGRNVLLASRFCEEWIMPYV